MPNTNSDLWCIDFINLFSVCTVFSSCFSIVHSKLINGDNARFINFSLVYFLVIFYFIFGTVNNFGDECLGSFSAPSIWF